jgi:hypothetical protein
MFLCASVDVAKRLDRCGDRLQGAPAFARSDVRPQTLGLGTDLIDEPRGVSRVIVERSPTRLLRCLDGCERVKEKIDAVAQLALTAIELSDLT